MKKVQKIIMGLAVLVALPVSVFAKSPSDSTRTSFKDGFKLTTLAIEMRGEYLADWLDGAYSNPASGFKGKFFNVRVGGNITDNFSYNVRWRVNRLIEDYNFFNSLDYAYLTYKTHGFEISAGKQVIELGGWEYDLAPIDIYYMTEFCSHVVCYAWGASLAYNFKEDRGSDKLTIQVSQSPAKTTAPKENLYGFHVMWRGTHGCFQSTYSVNMSEFERNKYINYIILGNRFNITDKLSLDFDLKHRYVLGQKGFFFRDFTAVGQLHWYFLDHFGVYSKCSYDVNKSGIEGDLCVLPGTEMWNVGAGFEYYPLQNRDIRLHAVCNYSCGNDVEGSFLKDNDLYLNVGVTWKVNFMNLISRRGEAARY